ncbi:CPBP family intramembrane glutamic endopeptidase [Candidatus Omnitrophota bacterium]
MQLILEALSVIAVFVLPMVIKSIYSKYYDIKEVKKLANIHILRRFIQSSGIILFMLYIATHYANGMELLGIKTSDAIMLLWGFPLYILFIALVRVAKFISGRIGRSVNYSRLDIKETLSMKSGTQRFFYVLSMMLMVVAEEMLFRGYLTLLLGKQLNALLVCAVASSFFYILMHLYVGKKYIINYIFMAIIFTIPTVLTKSIMIAVGAHLCNNTFYLWRIWAMGDQKE